MTNKSNSIFSSTSVKIIHYVIILIFWLSAQVDRDNWIKSLASLKLNTKGFIYILKEGYESNCDPGEAVTLILSFKLVRLFHVFWFWIDWFFDWVYITILFIYNLDTTSWWPLFLEQVIDWFIDWLIIWLFDWLIDWFIDYLIDLLIDWLIDCMFFLSWM